MSWGGSVRVGVSVSLAAVATFGRAVTSVVTGIFLGTESNATLTTESGALLLVEPVV
jgi:hypothetical protein